jgi:hypothetical protein
MQNGEIGEDGEYVEDEDWNLDTTTVDDQSDTFIRCDCPICSETQMDPEVMYLALQLRGELAADPEQVIQVMTLDCLRQVADMVGLTHFPTHAEVAGAIVDNPTSGLGAAALDHAVWQDPGLYGHGGVELQAQLNALEQKEYVRLKPVENFLLHTGSLHPGTVGEQHPGTAGNLIYPMHGAYVVSKISYHSDLTGIVVGGWRSVYLEPTGLPK